MELDRSSWVQIKRGAEASVWKMSLYGKNCIAKVQEPKGWRAPQLDQHLRSERIQNEARTNLRCLRLAIPIAPILYIDRPSHTLVMEELNGGSVKQMIFDMQEGDENDPKIIRALEEIGEIVAKLHDNEIIHSDLTTSNFMLHNGKVHVIDFGLSFVSSQAEDKAVDLYVLERAFTSSHPGKEPLLQIIMDSYCKSSPKSADVMKRLKKVRSRGRKRSMVG